MHSPYNGKRLLFPIFCYYNQYCMSMLVYVTLCFYYPSLFQLFMNEFWMQKPIYVCQYRELDEKMLKGVTKETERIWKSKRKNDTQRLDTTKAPRLEVPKSTSCCTVGHDVPVHVALLRCTALSRTGLQKGDILAMLELETARPRYLSTCNHQELPAPASFWEPEALSISFSLAWSPANVFSWLDITKGQTAK